MTLTLTYRTAVLVSAIFLTVGLTDSAGAEYNKQQLLTKKHTSSEPSASTAENRLALSRYQESIHQLEKDYGVYHGQIGEELISLGLVHRELGEYTEAVAAFDRALHINRINHGLHNLNQLPILQLIIDTNVEFSDWESLDQKYHQLLWTYRRNYDDKDPELFSIIDQVARWKIRAYTEELLEGNPIRTILDAERLYEDSINIIEQQYGTNDEQLITPLYGQALTNYQLAIHASNAPMENFQGVGSPERNMVVCRVIAGRTVCTTVRVPDPNYYSSQQQNKDFMVYRYISTAGKALRRIIDIHESNPELPFDSLARAYVHLGDWYLLKRKRTAAIENYKHAYQVLADNGANQDDIDKLFGKPQSIPTLRLPLPLVDEQLSPEKQPTYVLASFDVSSSGRTKNIHIIESNPENDTPARRKAKIKIRERIYRPRFENGEPVDTAQVKVRIVNK